MRRFMDVPHCRSLCSRPFVTVSQVCRMSIQFFTTLKIPCITCAMFAWFGAILDTPEALGQAPSVYSVPTPSVYQNQPGYQGQSVYPSQPLPPPATLPSPSPNPTFSGPVQGGAVPLGNAPIGTGLPTLNAPSAFPPAVVTSPVPAPNVRVADLLIQGYPARTGRIMFGGAVNSDAGVTGQVTIDERNFDITRWPRSFQDLISGTAFKGAGQTFRLEAVPGDQFQRYTLSFADPNLLGYLPISMSVSGFYYDRRFDDWDEGRLGGRLNFGYRITPDLSISAGVTGQSVDITNPSVTTVDQLNEVLGESSLFSGVASLIHDTRNSPLQPSEGHYIKASVEQAFGDYDYSRFEGEYRTYFLLRERADGSGKQTLQLSTRIGFSGDDTPIFENFFAGGYATMRGFDFRGANPIVRTGVADVEVGGRFQWLNTVEYMFPITADDAFRGVAFVDFGTVEEDIEVDADDFRVAPGFGFRVAIPMLGPAPLAFDFAFPVAMSALDDERVFTFYMSAVR